MRKIAERALAYYGLNQIRPKFINYSGNGLYQIVVPTGKPIPSGTYTLRLHQPNYMKSEYINSEMEWLSAMNKEGLATPKPIRNLDGNWLTSVDGGYNVPQARICTIIGWTDGKLLRKSIHAGHFYSLGKIIARIHNQAKVWKPPKGFARPHWDWKGLYGDGFDYGIAAQDARTAIPKIHQSAFGEVISRVHEVEDNLGKSRKYYGLIHADLAFGDNIVIQNNEAIPFDFDDCGFGYWIYDLAIALAHYIFDTNDMSLTMHDALIKGYQEIISIEKQSLEYLDLFIAARFAQLMFFFQGVAIRHPQSKNEAMNEVNSNAEYLKLMIKKMHNNGSL